MILAKKSLGQNFLKSERALNLIVETGEISPEDFVLEIGPGHGALTEKILAKGASVLAIEKDDNLFLELSNKFQKEIDSKKLELVHGDILDFNVSETSLKEREYKLIANIPYNITGAIFRKFLSEVSVQELPKRIVLLVQDEVARRIVAKDKKESLLSISIKAYGSPLYIEKVLAGSFVPSPKVDSAIICIENISKVFFKNFSEDNFFSLLNTGFHHKRKMLVSNLSEDFGRERVEKVFHKIGLDLKVRAEDVSLSKWREIASELSN